MSGSPPCGRATAKARRIERAYLHPSSSAPHESTRIDRRFAELKAKGRAALVTFLTAGDPDQETSLAILHALPAAGADVIELGMPFTDPMADGPAIQLSSQRALKSGQTMTRTLAMVRAFRATEDTVPIVLMGYYNPIYIYGVDRFLRDARAAGVDGLIVVDLPPEEDAELCLPALAAGLNFIRLATPTTDDRRLPAVLANTSGFVYYVSITGITGAAMPDPGTHQRGGRAHQAPLPASGGGGFRRAHGRTGGGDCARRRWRGGRLCTGECAQGHARSGRQGNVRNAQGGDRSRRAARARGARCPDRNLKFAAIGRGSLPRSPGADYIFAVSSPSSQSAGFQPRARPAGEVGAMNWISNVVRPKIRNYFARRDTPENLWIKCPETGQLDSTRTSRQISSSSRAPTITCA